MVPRCLSAASGASAGAMPVVRDWALFKKMNIINNIAVIDTIPAPINSGGEALQVAVDALAAGARKAIFSAEVFAPRFFDLSSGLAGEVMQKFVNYGLAAAIVGDFSKYPSKALQSLINEANQGRQLFFAATREEALEKLGGKTG
jgi:hypothetical protein